MASAAERLNDVRGGSPLAVALRRLAKELADTRRRYRDEITPCASDAIDDAALALNEGADVGDTA